MSAGRKPRGNRHQLPIRIPTELYEQIVRDADRLGVPKSDIVWAMVATSYRRKDLLPDTMRQDNPDQGELDVSVEAA